MPARSHLTRRAEKAREVQQEQSLQIVEETQQAGQRPRTRAWTKLEEQRKGEAKASSSASQPRRGKASPKQASVPFPARSSLQATPDICLPRQSPPIQAADQQAGNRRHGQTEKRKDTKASHEGRKRPFPEQQSRTEVVDEVPSGQSRVSPPRRPVISTWLQQLQTVSPEDARALPLVEDLPIIGRPTPSDPSMESSSSASRTTTQAPTDGVSTEKAARDAKPKRLKKLTWEKIRLRRIERNSTEDERTDHFKSILAVKPCRIRFKDITDLRSILKDFLQRCDKARPNDDSCVAIEDLSNQISRWRPEVNLVTITNREFDIDLSYCKRSNEAVLQRTVMTSIIDRWQLHELFVYNCEGQWNLPKVFQLPSRSRDDEVTLPKPDLAVSFTLEALTGTDTSSPFPMPLGSCMRPDGDVDRCFPFIFMEVKRRAHDLEDAIMANLHSASQALFNIFSWMSIAGHEEVFFDRVRVFSIVLNAQEISMRVHRAVPVPNDDSLGYNFDDIVTINGYNRDQACLLFRNVLMEYGKKELHGILKATFEEVSRQEVESKEIEDRKLESKRKADRAHYLASKKARSDGGTAASTIDVTSSFGASGLGIT